MTDISGIIQQLEAQKASIENAIKALTAVFPSQNVPAPARKRGRPAKAAQTPATKKGIASVETRRKLAEAMKRRWATKRAGKRAARS